MNALENSFIISLRALSIAPNSPLCVAVSGGSDSLCLAVLCSRLHKGKTTAVTVQTYWRESEAEDTEKLSQWLSRWNVHHVVLSHVRGKHAKKSEEEARKQRYQVLSSWCNSAGFLKVLTGHNREDQAVTFLMRAMRGSSLKGLQCMKEVSSLKEIEIVRPLLNSSRKEMQDFLKGLDQEWIDDPANKDKAFERNFLSSFLEKFEGKVGIDASKNLALSTKRLQRADQVVEEQVDKLERELAGNPSLGTCTLTRNFDGVKDEVLIRLVGRILNKIASSEPPFSLSMIEKFLGQIRGGKNFTIQGAVFLCRKGDFQITGRKKARKP